MCYFRPDASECFWEYREETLRIRVPECLPMATTAQLSLGARGIGLFAVCFLLMDLASV